MTSLKTPVEHLRKKKYNYSKGEISKGDTIMRVAICDDESVIRTRLHEAINASNALSNAEVAEYSSGHDLIDNHKKCPYNIVFLDIQMEEISGLETGQRLREIDKKLIIIFLTSYREFVFQSFKIEAFDYIVKPINNEEINDVLTRAKDRYVEQHCKISFKWKKNSYALDISDVVYFEIDKKYIKISTEDNEYMCIGKLDDYEHQLLPYGFLRCHKSFLVNMSYIKSIEKDTITTTYDNVLHMSVRKKQECLRTFNDFVAKYRI